MSELESYYKGGGSSAYHPKLLIKVWLYGYCEQIYTSRRLSKMIRENINFMWLSGHQQPCFKTLNSFRSGPLSDIVDLVFKEVLKLLIDLDYIDINDLYVDGSKWEANGNRHKVVWRKNTERYKKTVIARIELLLADIKQLQQEEEDKHGKEDLSELGKGRDLRVVITSEMVNAQLTHLSSLVSAESARHKSRMSEGCVESKEAKSDLEKDLGKLGKKLLIEQEKLMKYESQEAILGGRNSYNRTDEDATMLRMKDERLLPGYNVQHTTTHQYIVNYTIAQNASDSPTLIPHLEKMTERFEGLDIKEAINEPESRTLGADAGYGSEENYAYLEKKGIIAYVKYPLWYQEQTGELSKKMFKRENWAYDKASDTYSCPNKHSLKFTYERVDKTSNGYERTVRIYTCESCKDCPFAQQCKQTEDKNRTVQHSVEGERYKEQAKELLRTDRGKVIRKQRSIEVESVFGDLKFNMHHN